MSLEITEDLIARQPPEAQAIIRILLAKIADLEARLNSTPQNSSRPPGTQHPHARPARGRVKSMRKRGGQTGHPRHERSLIPSQECQEVIALKPPECRRCGTALAGEDDEPLRQARAGRRPIREEEGSARGSSKQSCPRSSRWSPNISGIA